MKNLKTIFTIIALMIGFGAFAQSEAKVICMVTKANWCPACKANGERMGKEVFSSYKDGNVQVVANDLTDDNTKKACKKDLEVAGISKIAEAATSTGIITIINAKTKEVITTISVAKSTEKIKAAINEAIKKV